MASTKLAPGHWAALCLAMACLAIFILLAFEVHTQGTVIFDQPVIQAMRSLATPANTELVKIITFWGSAPAVIVLAVAVTFFLKRQDLHPAESFLPAFTITGGWLLNTFMKESFQRLRPDSLPLVVESGFSFPSAHAMLSLAFYGTFLYLIWKNTDSQRLKWLSALGASLLILAIGLSRIYLGVHYPSDVAAGFAAGTLWLIICIAGASILSPNKSGELSP